MNLSRFLFVLGFSLIFFLVFLLGISAYNFLFAPFGRLFLQIEKKKQEKCHYFDLGQA